MLTTQCGQLSLVIPVYNSAQLISEIVARSTAVLSGIVQQFEIILVNDGSNDESWVSIQNAARLNPHVKGVNLGRNAGQHNALLCGIRLARFSVCVTMDDDLQFVPEDIPLLLQKLEDGYDVVYGAPKKQQHGLMRNLASQTIKLALKALIGGEIATYISPFRAFKTKLRDAFANAHGQFTLIDALLAWGTSKYAYVYVSHSERKCGQSNYTFGKLVILSISMITGFTTIPLRIATFNGILCISLGVFLLLYVLYCYVSNGGSVPGFPFLTSVTIIFSGAQLFALGIIGEYVGRLFEKDWKRPSYVVESVVELADEPLLFDCSAPAKETDLSSKDESVSLSTHKLTTEISPK